MTIRQVAGSVTAPSLSNWPWLPAGAGYLQTIYVSLPIALLGLAAFALPERTRERRVWAALAAGALGAAMLPLEGPFRYPSKLFALTLFVVALLAAEGLEGLRFAISGRTRVFAGVLALASAGLGIFLAGPDPAGRATVAGLGIGLALVAWDRSPARRGFFAAIASLFAAAHLAASALPLSRTADLAALLGKPLPPRGKVLTSEDEILSGWASRALPDETGRVRRQVDSLSGYSNLPFGIAKARTAAALPNRSQQVFMQSLTGLKDFLPLAAISGCGEVRFPRGEKMARVLVPDPLAGATFFFRDRAEGDSLAALKEIASGGVDFRRVLTVSSGRRLSIEAGARLPPGNVALASTLARTPERIEYSVTLSRDAWLYLPMSWDPWWRASIDGRPTEIEKANGVFSAVLVPGGDHRVLWVYRPWPFYAGAACSGLVLLVLVGRRRFASATTESR